jgi:hypothetical protein
MVRDIEARLAAAAPTEREGGPPALTVEDVAARITGSPVARRGFPE